jgi:DnaK suppressor protein
LDIEFYKRRLLEEQERLLVLIERVKQETRATTPDPIHDHIDGDVIDEVKDELFKEAEIHWTTLRQVRAALQRIEDGTYGRCLVDGEPIDEKRLEATPWAPYCLRHEEELEQSVPPKPRSL